MMRAYFMYPNNNNNKDYNLHTTKDNSSMPECTQLFDLLFGYINYFIIYLFYLIISIIF